MYEAVSTHFADFLAYARDRSGAELPKYVRREFERYLACGLLSEGFVRVYCDGCKHDFLVAFSCKCRGICPSCSTRRMTGTAASLLDRVFPGVPVRQWVLTLPYELRFLLAQNPKMLRKVHRILAQEVERAYVQATRALAPDAERKGGSVTFVQRFSGSLGLHVHFHLVAVDGVFARNKGDEGAPRFVPAAPPSREALATVVSRIERRVLRWLRRAGHLAVRPVEDGAGAHAMEEPLVSCLRAASTQGTLANVLDDPWKSPAGDGALGEDEDEADFGKAAQKRVSKWVAQSQGFNLHAGVTVPAGNRECLERLFRYGARPAIALDRLQKLADGRYAYRMKYAVRGKTHRVLEPMELMARLASMVPPPRYPLVRYSGVFAPSSPWRKFVVPPHPSARRCCAAHERERAQSTPAPTQSPQERNTEGVDGSGLDLAAKSGKERATRIDWAQLLRHGFSIEALTCPRCGGKMRPIAAVTDSLEVERMLAHRAVRRTDEVPSRAWDPVALAPP